MSRSHKNRFFCVTRTGSYDAFYRNYLNRRFRRAFDPDDTDQLNWLANMRKTVSGGTYGWDRKWGAHSVAELKELSERFEDPALFAHYYWK
jgi:hypothetical protein